MPNILLLVGPYAHMMINIQRYGPILLDIDPNMKLMGPIIAQYCPVTANWTVIFVCASDFDCFEGSFSLAQSKTTILLANIDPSLRF